MENVNFELHNFTDTLDSSNLGDTLCNISKSFSEFLVSFSKSDENFLKVPMLNNPIFTQGRHISRTFDANFFIGENAQVKNATLKQITWEKITVNNVVKSKDVINNLFNCNLDDNKHEILKRGWKIAKKSTVRGTRGQKLYRTLSAKVQRAQKDTEYY